MVLLWRGFTAKTAVNAARAITTMVTHVRFLDGTKFDEDIVMCFWWRKFGYILKQWCFHKRFNTYTQQNTSLLYNDEQIQVVRSVVDIYH